MHRVGRSWRWGVVVVVVALMAAAPAAVSAWAVRGSLALPAGGPLDDTAALFGKAAHLRAWVAGPDHWRVDKLSLTGEVDTYRDGEALATWDSSERRTVRAQ